MSYTRLPYTWGSKPLTWINSKTDANLYDTVWNPDWNCMEMWDGDIWVNDQAVKRITRGNSSDVFTPGKGVQLNNNGECFLSTDSGSSSYAGVCIRGTSVANVQSFILVAFMGTWPVSMSGAVTQGNHFELDTNGNFSGTSSPGSGACGVITETITSAGLVPCILQTVELV